MKETAALRLMLASSYPRLLLQCQLISMKLSTGDDEDYQCEPTTTALSCGMNNMEGLIVVLNGSLQSQEDSDLLHCNR
jgi:hypothetical protein